MSEMSQTAHGVLVRTLPAAIARAAASYDSFSATPPNPDGKDYIKDYAAFHAGCKTALQHLETLFKLAQSVADDAPSTSGPETGAETGAAGTQAEGAALSELVREARAAVGHLRRAR